MVTFKQLASEKDEKEREKWDILKKAKSEAEKSVLLISQLNQKDAQVRQLQEELFEVVWLSLASHRVRYGLFVSSLWCFVLFFMLCYNCCLLTTREFSALEYCLMKILNL